MEPKLIDIDLNLQFAELLNYYGVKTRIENGFIHTDLQDDVKFRAKSTYEDETPLSSLLTINCMTGRGEDIYELCRDSGETLEEAVAENFKNFASTLNPLLAALGSLNPYSYENTTITEWEIDGKVWEAYIGQPFTKIVQQTSDHGYTLLEQSAPTEFIESMKSLIPALPLDKRLHWLRGYYCQSEDKLTVKEFLMDNYPIEGFEFYFDNLPLKRDVEFFSSRAFILLKEKIVA